MNAENKPGLPTRRQFVATSALGSAAMAVGCKRVAQGNWDFLNDEQARTLTALCDQIIPADDFPSASQAGVLNYIDRQLARAYQRHRDDYRDGLQRALELSRSRFRQDPAALTQKQQLEWVSAIEKGDRSFFEMVRRHTFEGYYGSPRHGGNLDAVSWKMLGLAEPPNLGRSQYDLSKGGRS